MRALLALAGLGCAPTAPPDGDVEDQVVMLEDAHNYRYQATVDIGQAELAERADATIAWEGLTTDMQLQPIDPAQDVDTALLVVFGALSPEEVELGVASETLLQSDIQLYAVCEPTEPACALSSFTFFGLDLDVETLFEPTAGTWMVVLTTNADNPDAAPRYRMMTFLVPSADSDADVATIHDGSTVVDASAEIAGAEPLVVPAGRPLTVDWSRVETDHRGEPLAAHQLDTLEIAVFRSLSVAELEARFVEIQALADARWTLDVTGADRADLTGAVTTSGEAFPGVDGDGTWLLSLGCATCTSPVPRVLAVLDGGG